MGRFWGQSLTLPLPSVLQGPLAAAWCQHCGCGGIFAETKRAEGSRTKGIQSEEFKERLVEKGLPLSPSCSRDLA